MQKGIPSAARCDQRIGIPGHCSMHLGAMQKDRVSEGLYRPSLLGILPITARMITSSKGPVLRITKYSSYMITRQWQILGKQSADS